jgi:hypothetical protein
VASVKRLDGATQIDLPSEERDVLAALARDVATLLQPDAVVEASDGAAADPLEAAVGWSDEPVAAPLDPAVHRLLPDAYADADEAAEFRRLMDGDLRGAKVEALQLVVRSAETADGAIVVTDDDVDSWLHAINDIRLVLGVRLDITEDDRPRRLRAGDPRRPMLAAYDWLTWLQDAVLRGLLGEDD